ncbi:MAG: hypothetical protein KDB14_20545 [Planctomycetales bacterium]|nr:hypothetical protein [Planctomycetales bacterium]
MTSATIRKPTVTRPPATLDKRFSLSSLLIGMTVCCCLACVLRMAPASFWLATGKCVVMLTSLWLVAGGIFLASLIFVVLVLLALMAMLGFACWLYFRLSATFSSAADPPVTPLGSFPPSQPSAKST